MRASDTDVQYPIMARNRAAAPSAVMVGLMFAVPLRLMRWANSCTHNAAIKVNNIPNESGLNKMPPIRIRTKSTPVMARWIKLFFTAAVPSLIEVVLNLFLLHWAWLQVACQQQAGLHWPSGLFLLFLAQIV